MTALEANTVSSAAVGFGKSTLSGASTPNITTLSFGPDGRLYTASQDGTIRILTVERSGENNYDTVDTETLSGISSMPNHDDDGSLNTGVSSRLVTGLTVAGSSTNPVIYVGSSDPRIGAGPSGDDLNLDTNSGIITRITWTGSSWDYLDLVRGLPRSEENHTANGLDLDTNTNTLYVAQGGNTNHGAPSNNFAGLPEVALSAAVLSIDLDTIGNTTYDLPTLNDEDRPGVNDSNDPFGGNNGQNQAVLVPGGPVQVYAPGFRNPYDLELAQSGRLYVTDNGGNAGWGAPPSPEGPTASCTNDFSEPGQTEIDTLHLVTGPGYYGGHPNPTRGNAANTFNSSNPQSPVSASNPIECDFQSVNEKSVLGSFPESTNGLAEYTTGNFGGELAGDLLTASFDNTIYHVDIDPTTGLAVSDPAPLFESVGSLPLDLTIAAAADPFPGTVWVGDYVADNIVIFEPNDYDGNTGPVCTGDDDPALDEDGDGFSNADEIDNTTNGGYTGWCPDRRVP